MKKSPAWAVTMNTHQKGFLVTPVAAQNSMIYWHQKAATGYVVTVTNPRPALQQPQATKSSPKASNYPMLGEILEQPLTRHSPYG